MIRVPASWNGQTVGSRVLPGFGSGTYRLEILSEKQRGLGLKVPDIASAARVSLNGRELARFGQPGDPTGGYTPVWGTGVFPIRLREGSNQLVIEVSNYSYHKGGLWKPLEIGPIAAVVEKHTLFNYVNMSLFGALMMMGVYYLLFYTLRPRAHAELFISLFCFCTALRALMIDNRLLQNLTPQLSFELLMKLEFFSFYVGLPAFFGFLFVLVRGAILKIPMYGYLAIMLVLNAAVALTPASFYGGVNPYVVIMTILFGAYVTIALGVAAVRGHQDALFPLIGGIIFLAAGTNDALKTRELVQTPTLLPLGLFAFVAMQAFALSKRAERMRRTTEALSTERAQMGDALRRFVPEEFLRFLGSDLRDIRIGQAIQADLTVSFTDIRNFTSFSESLGSDETMRFLNGYYQRANPLVKSHRGFIDKFIGDGMMALFPHGADDAVGSAVATLQEMGPYNEWRVARGWEPIRIGIGINSGPVTLGTVGDSTRMETTVVGDTVNLAARLESLNKRLHTTLLMSAETRRMLTGKHHLREVAFLHVRGKLQPVSVYECFDSDPPALIEQKTAGEADLRRGLALFQAGEIREAFEAFVAASRVAPADPIISLHIERCRAGLDENTSRSRATRTVLVVEDNPAMRTILEHRLTGEGLRPVWAASAEEAASLIRRNGFDVMVSDLHLPDGDGLELIGRIRSDAANPMEFFLLTADDSPEVRARASAMDVELFIKPADIQRMARVVAGREQAII